MKYCSRMTSGGSTPPGFVLLADLDVFEYIEMFYNPTRAWVASVQRLLSEPHFEADSCRRKGVSPVMAWERFLTLFEVVNGRCGSRKC